MNRKDIKYRDISIYIKCCNEDPQKENWKENSHKKISWKGLFAVLRIL